MLGRSGEQLRNSGEWGQEREPEAHSEAPRICGAVHAQAMAMFLPIGMCQGAERRLRRTGPPREQGVFACVCSWPLLCVCAKVPRGGGVLYVSVSRRFTVPPPVLQRSAALRTSPARLVFGCSAPATTPRCIVQTVCGWGWGGLHGFGTPSYFPTGCRAAVRALRMDVFTYLWRTFHYDQRVAAERLDDVSSVVLAWGCSIHLV